MKWMTDIEVSSPPEKLRYPQSVFLIGSCFTEHIGNRLGDLKFPVCQNPNGILFDPRSVCSSLQSYIEAKQYTASDLFFMNDLWQSWQHHSIFSGVDQQNVLVNINKSQQVAHDFLSKADWLIITLGSAYAYQLSSNSNPVANCHRAPAQTFDKVLIPIVDITQFLQNTVDALIDFNPRLKVVFTISPVRHLREGVINNNRSKARLIEAVHEVVDANDRCTYFPAYELVVDVLRDYRFFDIDLAHPNYAATEFVFEKFETAYIDVATRQVMQEIKTILNAVRHKAHHPETTAHRRFIEATLSKAKKLQQDMPHLDLSDWLLSLSQAL